MYSMAFVGVAVTPMSHLSSSESAKVAVALADAVLPGCRPARARAGVLRVRRARLGSVRRHAASSTGETRDVEVQDAPEAHTSATECVQAFYAAWNRSDLDAMMCCIAEDAEYEDAIFPSPAKGKEEVARLFGTIMKVFPKNAEFIVDKIADGGKSAGCKWHVELNGKPLPFSRGNSFYEIDDDFRIHRAFETPEPFIKNGNGVLGLLSLVTKLLRL